MLKRLFHNVLQSFRKDGGAHFTYNIGVSFVRTGAVIIGVSLLIFGLSFLHLGSRLRYDSDIRVEITGSEIIRYKDNWLINLVLPRFRYRVDFRYEENGLQHDRRQFVTKEEYNGYVELSELSSFTLKRYKADDGSDYLSIYDHKLAERAYREVYPSLGFKLFAFWVFAAGLPILLIGLGEERLAMKYPRSDVNIGDTSIVLHEEAADDLLGEFEREYSRTHRNWAADPPAGENSDGDGALPLPGEK